MGMGAGGEGQVLVTEPCKNAKKGNEGAGVPCDGGAYTSVWV